MLSIKQRRPQTLAQKIGNHLEKNKTSYLKAMQFGVACAAIYQSVRTRQAKNDGDIDTAINRAYSAGRLSALAVALEASK